MNQCFCQVRECFLLEMSLADVETCVSLMSVLRLIRYRKNKSCRHNIQSNRENFKQVKRISIYFMYQIFLFRTILGICTTRDIIVYSICSVVVEIRASNISVLEQHRE